MILDVDTGHAITTDVLRYGQRIAVLALPCHPLLRTPEALAVVGPHAFGLDVEYRPLPDRMEIRHDVSEPLGSPVWSP